MIKIKEHTFLHSRNLFLFQLENNDKLYLTVNELETLINNENTDEIIYSMNDVPYNPVFSGKEYSDDTIELIAFNILTFKLIVKDHGNIIQEERFIDFASLKQWLVNNSFNLFNWIQDNEPEIEIPDFQYDETIQDLKTSLKDYNYNWWTVYIITE